ncbi:substrate-binding periplasmic protein [Chitinimonas sp.]|uniref:substrate-binding periplasmic protein n=1 Tax=Chitinimonas sp. TaxID=1934313 RepID=UPI0035AF86BA
MYCLRCCLLALLLLCAHAQERLRLASGEWPPYAGEALPGGGLGAHIISAAFAEADIVVEYQYLSWKRGLEMARQGKLDGAILWGGQRADQQEFLATQPVVTSQVVLFHRREKPLDGKAPVKGYRLAYPNGYDYEVIPGFIALAQASGIAPLKTGSDRDALRALLNNRIDAYPADRLVGIYLLQEAMYDHWQEHIAITPSPLSIEELGVLISQRHPHAKQLVRRFNAGLAALQQKGLIARWLAEADLPAAKSHQ